ncbi:hypothetical protein HPB51_021990 [Rhipicephalus microplus]|uniref:Ubiquitin-conjugating enzyme E2 Z n=1 Tax=Rhipicephalus microplus TaxID=6941 RepID=A0A9J6DIQ7_RHIMP|nr:hypothetical protein HPB51_021990 [Rhipicephalus microplus]
MSSELDVDVPRRLKKEVAALTRDPPPGIYAAPDENDITRIHALVVGPSGTPYEGGFLLFHLVYPLEYPNKPPVVRFLTTDAGRVWLHPYLYESGEVSLSILGTFSGPQWSPGLSLGHVLLSIQSLLSENPYYDRLFRINDATTRKRADDYNIYIRHEVVRVAVCDAVESCFDDGSSYPSALREPVLKLFLEHYDSCEEYVKRHLRLRCAEIGYPSICPLQVSHYETLLARLQDLKAKVEKRG